MTGVHRRVAVCPTCAEEYPEPMRGEVTECRCGHLYTPLTVDENGYPEMRPREQISWTNEEGWKRR